MERLFRFFGLENLRVDPEKTMLPLLPKTLEVRPEPADWKKNQPSWTDMLDEDADYQIMLAESLYGDVYKQLLQGLPHGPDLVLRSRQGVCH